MKKKNILTTLFLVFLVSCGGNTTSSEIRINTSIRDVMTEIKKLTNYTVRVEDEIFDVVSLYKFTEKAMYYEPSKLEHGGTSLGQAISNENEVFEYIIENNEIVAGSALTDSNGNKYDNLYEDVVLSLRDLDIESFTDVKSEDNKYIIDQNTDPINFLVFVGLAGYYDTFALPYLSLSIEITGEMSFIATVHFNTGNAETTGDIHLTIEEIGSTTIPYINEYLDSGKGAKESSIDVDNIIDFMQKVKDSKNYQVEVETESSTYVDIYHNNYYFTYDKNNPSSNSGYAIIGNSSIYNITKDENGDVVLGNEISYTVADQTDLWGNVVSNRSFASLNLSSDQFVLTQVDDELVLTNQYGVLSILLARTHAKGDFGFGPSADTKNDKVVFFMNDQNSLTYTYTSEKYGVSNVTISELECAQDISIEEFIESSQESFDSSDISELKNTLNELKNSKNYTISIEENFSWMEVLQIGNRIIKFTENHYYLNHLEDENKSFGYFCEDNIAFKYTLDNEMPVKETDLSNNNIWSQFTSFNSFSENALSASRNVDGSFVITDESTISLIGRIAGFSGPDFYTNITSLNVKINDTEIIISGTNSFYGTVTLNISNIGTTTLEPISLA